jgi:ubiquinone/menaquinone biosynthesis C-methylase UbiE
VNNESRLSELKDYEKLSRSYYNKVASRFDYSLDGVFSLPFKKLIAHDLKLDEGAKILDVGSANGKLLDYLSRKQAINGFGLEISENFVAIARQSYPQFSFHQGSALSMPFPKDSFDVLICSASFHHFPNPRQFLKEARRVLKNDGRLVIAEIHLPIFLKYYNQYLDKYNHEGDVKVYSPRELAHLFAISGFELIKKRIILQIQYYELK